MFGLSGLAWAQPVADLSSTLLALGLYLHTYSKLARQQAESQI